MSAEIWGSSLLWNDKTKYSMLGLPQKKVAFFFLFFFLQCELVGNVVSSVCWSGVAIANE